MSSNVATQDSDRIERAAIAIYTEMFTAQRQEQYKPREGTLMRHLWDSKRLTLQHQRAWRHFTNDLHGAHGRSGPVTSGYGESTSSRSTSEFRAPRSYVNAEYRRVEKLYAQMSAGAERALMADLMHDEVRPNGTLVAENIGFHVTGYRNEDQARAAGVATIIALLGRIADFYSIG